MKIAEIFHSRQGEGLLTGVASAFVRASGCNLRCWFCDTPYASWAPEGDDLAVEEILERVADFQCEHVVLTGGEPMLFAESIPLATALSSAGHHITVETAGTLYLPVKCDLMSISPKLAGSGPRASLETRWLLRHERARHAPRVIRRLIEEFQYQFKFVVDHPADAEESVRYLDEFSAIDRTRVYLMPQGVDMESLTRQAAWLEPFCARHGLGFCARRQIEWFGLTRGT